MHRDVEMLNGRAAMVRLLCVWLSMSGVFPFGVSRRTDAKAHVLLCQRTNNAQVGLAGLLAIEAITRKPLLDITALVALVTGSQ